jgi:hypothetical protein
MPAKFTTACDVIFFLNSPGMSFTFPAPSAT